MSSVSNLENLITKGHYAQARILAEELLRTDSNTRIKQLYALSLSKSGVPEAARDYLESIVGDQASDPETIGILGSIYKELFKKNQSPRYAILARDTYYRNFELTKNYYTGINAATMSSLAGQSKRGKEIAQEVLSLLKNTEHDFWEVATLGEAFLLMKERSKADEAYRRAIKLAGTDWGRINSVYNQLWLMNHYLPVPADIIKAFRPPVVVAFIGHMIDHPDRSFPRFPPSIENEIKNGLLNAIKTLNAKIGYCSLACGGDILFAEAMEEAGGEVNLFLPFTKTDFIEASVRFAGEGWVERLERLLDKYPVTYVTGDAYENHPDLFLLQSNIIFGLSVLRSAASHQEPTLVSVLSERDQKKKTGGTRDTLDLWPFKRNHVNVNPDIFVPGIPATASDERTPQKTASSRPVLYLVACDSHEDLPATFLADTEFSSLPVVAVDIRQDYLIAGFKTIFSAMEFCEWIQKAGAGKFTKRQFSRISLHACPVNVVPDSIHQELSGEGIDLIKAMHRIALPGSIYATAFAAAVLSLEKGRYSFDFVDTLPVAKGKVDVFRMRTTIPSM